MSDDAALFAEPPIGLFGAFGIELEYMVVDAETLAVRPVVDDLLAGFHPQGLPSDQEDGPVGWSNELVLHVIELKTNGPARHLDGWAERFLVDLRRIREHLATRGCMLLPGAAHPTMDPVTETVLWPHDYGEVYATYDRIFGCRRHGWANLQSCHLNLPFAGDQEFARLHAAVRAVLPLVPALAAGSPVRDGQLLDVLDGRLQVYCTHQNRLPVAMGQVIPEPLSSQAAYDAAIFAPLRAAAAPLDPAGLLRPEFLNARGAIARFERSAIEVRLLDVQETPRADLAICLLVSAAIRMLCDAPHVTIAELDAIPTGDLAALLHATLRDADQTLVEHPGLLAAFGVDRPLPAGELWSRLRTDLRGAHADFASAWQDLDPALDVILDQGPLARRLLKRLGAAPGRATIDALWRELGDCLVEDRLFEA